MFGYLHAPLRDVKDLAADDPLRLAESELNAALRADNGRVNDELIGACDLSESRAAMTELSARFHPGLMPQASGAAGFLPRRIC